MANSEEEKPAFYVENSKITLIDCEIEGFKTPFEVRGDSTVSGSGTRILREQQSKRGGGSGFWAVVVGGVVSAVIGGALLAWMGLT
ncbi:hypothetical protein [Stenotrophomonas sp. NPDC078853]|uniref:hypothetical protein n=1 Tax=Stenotrophomonas sp. NPDC078853 TaxID=3364534 RepID=UPI00384F9088